MHGVRVKVDMKTPAGYPCPSLPPKLMKLLDLPNKFLNLIFEYLNSNLLFWLSMTCRVLHYVALPAFFEQNNVKELASGWVVVLEAVRKTLQAL